MPLEALRCFRGHERLEEVPENVNGVRNSVAEAKKVLVEVIREPVGKTALTRIPIPSRMYLIDTGNEGRARDSFRPLPHPPGDLFLTDKPDESR